MRKYIKLIQEIWGFIRWELAEWISPELADQARFGRRALSAVAEVLEGKPASLVFLAGQRGDAPPVDDSPLCSPPLADEDGELEIW